MGLASVVQHSVKAPPLKHDTASLRVSRTSALKQTRVPFPHSHFSASFAVTRGRRGQFYAVANARGTEQEDDLSTSGAEGPTSQAHDDLDKVNSSPQAFPSVDKQEQRSHGHETYRPSFQTVALCVCAAVAFGIGIGLKDGVGKATEFFTGYILEQSLSVDNLFVFVLIFKYFKVPLTYQNRVLSYGIAGAIVFRLSLILLGAATLQRFEAVNLLLAVILLYSSFKLFASEDDETDLSNNFVVKTCQRFIPVTSYYDGNRFTTNQNGVWKASTILGRLLLYFSQ